MTDWHPDIPVEYRNQIVTGDARELAKRIPDESIDIVFTSPPYNTGMDYGVWNDNMEYGEFWHFQKQWLEHSFRVARDGARFYAVVSDAMIYDFKKRAALAGWKYHQILVWCKPNMCFPYGNRKWDWSQMTEYGLLFHKGSVPDMRNEITGINTHNWTAAASAQSNYTGTKKKIFPAQMSFEVALTWLGRTPGQIVYEPFAGSGTTLLAAQALQKDFIAFEIDPDTAELARKRVRETNPPLFTLPPQPEQGDLFD